MDRRQVAHDFHAYLIDAFRSLRNPQDHQRTLRDFDGRSYRSIEDVADVFTQVLVRGSDHPLLAGLSDDILGAFRSFQTVSLGDKQQLRECADCFALKLEPFWKLVLQLTTGEEPRKDGIGARTLLGKVLPHSWQDGNQIDKFITFAREWRHVTAHNAPEVPELDLRLYVEAALGVYLLVVEENYDKLAPVVLGGVQRMLQDRAGQARYLTTVANPPNLTAFYVPSIGAADESGTDSADLEELIDHFLLDKAAHVLLLTGEAGAGKSTFLRRKLADIAQKELDRLTTERRILRMPIYYPLEDLSATLHVKLERILVHHVMAEGGWHAIGVQPEELFASGRVTCVVGLDGLDELRDWDLGTGKIVEFLEDYAETEVPVKVIMSTRPSVLSTSWRNRYPIVEIKDWTEAEIQLYMQRRSSRLSEVFLDWLEAGQLLDVVRLPLLLENVTDFWLQSQFEIEDAMAACEDAILTRRAAAEEIEAKTVEELTADGQSDPIDGEERDRLRHRLLELVPPLRALDQAIVGLLEHQLAKLSGPDRHSKIDGLLTSLQQLAFELDGQDSLDVYCARNLAGNDLDHLVRMSLITRRRQEVRFSHDLIKLCLAAKEFGYRLQREVDFNQGINDFVSRLHGSPEFWQRCYVAASQVLPVAAPFPISLSLFAEQHEGRSVT